MLNAQFALWFLFLWLAAISLYVSHQGTMRGGPFFYVDARGSGESAIQPKFRVVREKLKDLEYVLEAHFDRRGMPWLVKRLRHGKEIGRTYYFRDASGKLRYSGPRPPWEAIKLQPVAADPNI